MADENQELQAQMNALRQQLQGLEEAAKSSQVGLSAFGKATQKGAGDLTKGLAGFAMQVGKGDTNFKSLNTIVDITSDALAGMAKAIPYAGDAVAAGLKAAAEGAKFMLDQMDQTTKAFNDLGAAGALAADGMTGLQQQFLKSGLSLQTYSKLVSENGQALARMGGMVNDGAKAFTNITEHFTNLTGGGDDALRKLGMNSEQIGDTVAAFVTQQTRLGRSQQMSSDELRAGTRAYALELDALQKVTGMSREAIQKQQDAALSESRFRANYESKMAEGTPQAIAAAKAMMALQTQMNAIGPELGQATRDLMSGAANTEASTKLMASTGGAAQDIINRLKDGQIDQSQAAKEMQDAVRRTGVAARENAKFVDKSNSAYLDYAQQRDLETATILADGTVVKKVQDAQINKTDDLTKTTIDAQKNMEGLNREMQKLGFTFLPGAAKATEAVTKAMNGLVKYINEKILGIAEEGPAREAPASEFDAMGNVTGVSAAQTPEEEAALRANPAYAAARKQAGAGTASPTSQSDLASMGLKIKQGDVQAEGATISNQLIELAKKVQAEIPGFAYFSGFNDKYHQGKNASKHPKGMAMDFALQKAPSPEEGRQIADMLRSMGASYVQDEYNNPSAASTAGHIHAEVSAARGAILSGPASGYKPNLTMHGTEAIVPLNNPNVAASIPGMGGMDLNMLTAQLDKMDEMVSVLKRQLGVSEKLLSYQS
jgi:hypothetical protein